MNTIAQDLPHSFRTLIRKPGFTIPVVLALALGLGANTAVFSVANTILLRSLPFPDADRLMLVWERNVKNPKMREWPVSQPNFSDWRAAGGALMEMAALGPPGAMVLTGSGDPQRLSARSVSANIFTVLRQMPSLGRTFTGAEEQAKAPLVIINNRLWKRQFGGAPNIIGRSIMLDAQPYTVIGILPPHFSADPWIGGADVWLSLSSHTPQALDRSAHSLYVLGRLRDGVSVGQAQTGMDLIARKLQQAYPDSTGNWGITVTPLEQQEVVGFRPLLFALLGASGFVLLIACANVANLMLARAVARETELAVRVAIGAGTGSLLSLALSESLLLSLAGGALGFVLAVWCVSLFKTIAPGIIPRVAEVSIDPTTLGFTLAISLFTTVLLGLVPAMHAMRADGSLALKSGNLTSTGTRRRMRGVLVAAEVALAMALLNGTSLLAKSFFQLRSVHLGFDPKGLITMRITAPYSGTGTPRDLVVFYDRILERLGGIPGIGSIGLVSSVPLSEEGGTGNYFVIASRPRPERGAEPEASTEIVSPNYFETMRIPLVRGRFFTPQDVEGAPRVAVISETLARRYFPGQDPIGQVLTILPPMQSDVDEIVAAETYIVGVVEDVKHYSLSGSPFNEIYVPFRQNPVPGMYLVVRSASDLNGTVPAIRHEVAALDPHQPVYDVKLMTDRIASGLALARFTLFVVGVFGALAILLAVIGIYAIVTQAVSQRVREIGIRMALGATPADILKLIVGQTLCVTAVGIGIGVVLSLACAQALASLLYETAASHSPTLASSTFVIGAVAALAAWIAARKGSRVDPASVLRLE